MTMIPGVGRLRALDDINADSTLGGWKLCLFKTATAPLVGSTWATFVEADFSGYARATPSFPGSGLDGGNRAVSGDAARTFSHNGGATANNIYGWVLLDTVGNVVIAASMLPAPPKVMAALGDTLTITLTDTLTQG